MPFVLDASPAVAWALGEPDSRAVLARERLRTDQALAPTLWWFELRNALLANERRGRLTEFRMATFLQELSELPISLDHSPHEATVLALARRHRLTVYDAAYLELALREGVSLATLDGALAAAAKAEKVPALGE